MRLRLLLLSLVLCIGAAAAPHFYDDLIGVQKVPTVILATNGTTIKFCDTTTPTKCDTRHFSLSAADVSAGNQVIVQMAYEPAYMNIDVRNTPVPCNDNPCEIDLVRTQGMQFYITEVVNSSGASFSPPRVGHLESLPMVEPPPCNPIQLPLKVIGFAGFVNRCQVTIPSGAATTGVNLHLTIANHQINGAPFILTGGKNQPYDSKLSYQVCGSAGCTSWLPISNSTVTSLDPTSGAATDGVHTIATQFTVINVSVPVPNNGCGGVSCTLPGTDTIGFRFNGTDGITRGARILNLALVDSSTVTTLSQLVVSTQTALAGCTPTGNVAPCVIATATAASVPFANNDNIWVWRAPGIYGRFNGRRFVRNVTGTTFDFLTCANGQSGSNVAPTSNQLIGFDSISCTAPTNGSTLANGYVVPSAYVTPVTYATMSEQSLWPVTQAALPMQAVKIIAPATSSFTYDDPTTFRTATMGAPYMQWITGCPVGNPSGCKLLGRNYTTPDATAGATAWLASDTLLTPAKYRANLDHATCGECHTTKGIDWKTYNEAPDVLAMAAMVHNLPLQSGLNMMAYQEDLDSHLGGLPDAFVSSFAKPWNAPYQPCPGLNSVPNYAWTAGGGWMCTIGYDTDLQEYEPFGTWGRGSVDYRELPMVYQYPTWFQWISVLHPKDACGSATPCQFANSMMWLGWVDVKTAADAGTASLTLASISCAGTPGNTTASYTQQCKDTNGQAYVCHNMAGCTVSGDWTLQVSSYNNALLAFGNGSPVPSHNFNQTGVQEFRGSIAYLPCGGSTSGCDPTSLSLIGVNNDQQIFHSPWIWSAAWTQDSPYTLFDYGATGWYLVKAWELFHTPRGPDGSGYEAMDDQYMFFIHGARASGNYEKRNWHAGRNIYDHALAERSMQITPYMNGAQYNVQVAAQPNNTANYGLILSGQDTFAQAWYQLCYSLNQGNFFYHNWDTIVDEYQPGHLQAWNYEAQPSAFLAVASLHNLWMRNATDVAPVQAAGGGAGGGPFEIFQSLNGLTTVNVPGYYESLWAWISPTLHTAFLQQEADDLVAESAARSISVWNGYLNSFHTSGGLDQIYNGTNCNAWWGWNGGFNAANACSMVSQYSGTLPQLKAYGVACCGSTTTLFKLADFWNNTQLGINGGAGSPHDFQDDLNAVCTLSRTTHDGPACTNMIAGYNWQSLTTIEVGFPVGVSDTTLHFTDCTGIFNGANIQIGTETILMTSGPGASGPCSATAVRQKFGTTANPSGYTAGTTVKN